jgi:single-strand DNA-binding protein
MGHEEFMINCTLVGHLGADPESKQTATGSAMCRLRVASAHGYGDRKSTTWVSVTAFGKCAEFAARYLAKGDHVIVTGKMYMREWQDQAGVTESGLALDADSVDSLRPPQQERQPERRPAPRPADPPTDDPAGHIPF